MTHDLILEGTVVIQLSPLLAAWKSEALPLTGYDPAVVATTFLTSGHREVDERPGPVVGKDCPLSDWGKAGWPRFPTEQGPRASSAHCSSNPLQTGIRHEVQRSTRCQFISSPTRHKGGVMRPLWAPRGAVGVGVSAPGTDTSPFDTLFNAFRQSLGGPCVGASSYARRVIRE